MLFSSVEFLFLFLPAALALFIAARALGGPAWSIAALTLASLAFYALWKPEYLPLLIASVAANWLLAGRIQRARRHRPALRAWTAVGVAFNLALLFWFKYALFAATQLNLADRDVTTGLAALLPRVLPLAISFYTFQQIAYLVDVSRGLCDRAPFTRHLLLVTFFPHLIAGPITHPAIVFPQLERLRPTWPDAALGLFILAVGLAKKVCLADPIGRFVDPGFADPAALGALHAWATVVGYTLQLYFDFSGYSDMAVGLALLFGVRLPWNFLAPYKATSIADFWRRWHVTLGDFLRRYLYIPLGGSRAGRARTLANLLVTMALGGLWHGAGWTFLLWGLLHGSALALNHAWRWTGLRLPAPLGWALTMLVVVVGWALFRARSTGDAHALLARMATLDAGPRVGWTDELLRAAPFLALAALLALVAPSSRQLADRFRPTRPWALFGAALMALAMLFVLGEKSPPEFLYFEF